MFAWVPAWCTCGLVCKRCIFSIDFTERLSIILYTYFDMCFFFEKLLFIYGGKRVLVLVIVL